MLKRTNEKGFTLVELLIVIVIIGILAGLVITIINPRRMQQRSGHSIIRANVGRACQALTACASSTTNLDNCDTPTEAGINVPTTPPGVAYPAANTDLGGGTTLTYANTASTQWDNCVYTCTYSSATGTNTLTGSTQCIDN